MKYQSAIKKPIPVQFMKLELKDLYHVYTFINGKPPYEKNASIMIEEKWYDYENIISKQGYMSLKTLESGEGTQNANIGDYILKGIDGECWPVKADIFERTYDIVNP